MESKKELTLNEYQEKAMTTCLQSSKNPLYMLFMLGEEVGELQGKFSKAIRKGNIQFNKNQIENTFNCFPDSAEWIALVMKEIGDVLWGCAGLCSVMGWSLEDVAKQNLNKLASRQQRNVIEGNGDNR